MKIYLVGGAVRDALMGLPMQDRDWVVVGSTPQALLDLGYTQVGRDFPVFLHPTSHEEYALARTERKTAPGYTGFAVHADPGVTLEEDLARRDLTINAIALPAERLQRDGHFEPQDLIDPFQGRADLTARVLRHVTPAFREDPVRILRLARFAARFAGFSAAPETLSLMQQMVQDGEVDHLVAERVWQELAKGLMEARPSRMFAVLRDCHALVRLLPELDRLWGVPQSPQHHPEVYTGVHVMLVLDMAAQLQASLAVRFACLMHDLGKGTTPVDVLPRHIGHEGRSVKLLQAVCKRLRVPVECAELAEVVAREHGNIHRSAELGPDALLRLLERCDAIRKPARMAEVLLACECDARGRTGFADAAYPQRPRLLQALEQVLSVATAPVAADAQQKGATGLQIGAAVRQARLAALSLPTT
ncbi:multifunctional CCA addition/repair protein [Rhodoferax lacus]|uniref:Multifunctional CCA protein n=1 Tax=Rhodoferax lacus TaxID=2184758 RepID=A0A3E1RA65_9BURK|nr:multifunctional CCA addition/repair protein [Rhodoferax lacus]RFO96256.1 multifunctional CCA addition/repair protein [Rhodoferax lacus]